MHTLRRTVLTNGLVVLTIHQPALRHAALRIALPFGSWDDPARKSGLAHFYEHMSFRGTARHPTANDLARAMDDLCGDSNAYTDRSRMTFNVSGPCDALAPLAEHVVDMLTAPAFEDVESERRVVQEERLGTLDPSGSGRCVYDLALWSMYGAHPFVRPIIGTEASIDRITEDDFCAHRLRHAHAAGAVLTVVSPLSHDEMEGAVFGALSRLPAGPGAPVTPREVPELRTMLPYAERSGQPTGTVLLAFPTPSASSPDMAALQVIRAVLADGMSSRLWQAVRGDASLAYQVDAWWYDYEFAGQFGAYCVASHGNIGAVARAMAATLADFAWQGPTPEEMGRAQRRLQHQTGRAEEHAEDLEHFYTNEETSGTRRSLREYMAHLNAVTAGDVVRVARDVFRPSRMHAVATAKLRGANRAAFMDVGEEYARLWKRARAASHRG